MSTVSLSVAFLMGFTMSLHCAGMCGPIMTVMPFQKFGGFKKGLAIGLYHLGRISVYALFAVLLHSFKGVFNPRIQQYVSVVLGVTLLMAGVVSFFPANKWKIRLPWAEFVKRSLGRLIWEGGLGSITAAGMLNGMLPCGLVYVALSASLSAPTVGGAALFMYAFGVGTMPILLGVILLSKSNVGRLTANFLHLPSLKRLVPMLMLVFGGIFVLRGMNLGIPYLSPKVELGANHVIKSCCCCHKPKQ
jgi:uncharacterized protein